MALRIEVCPDADAVARRAAKFVAERARVAAATVQRPSPESDTRPANSESVGLSSSACAVRSSSQEATTLPRRHSSAMSATFSS